jgi:hypothetical protein
MRHLETSGPSDPDGTTIPAWHQFDDVELSIPLVCYEIQVALYSTMGTYTHTHSAPASGVEWRVRARRRDWI